LETYCEDGPDGKNQMLTPDEGHNDSPEKSDTALGVRVQVKPAAAQKTVARQNKTAVHGKLQSNWLSSASEAEDQAKPNCS